MSDDLLLLGAGTFLLFAATKDRPLSSSPAQQALINVRADPLVSGNYSNEKDIYDAILAAPNAAAALKAAKEVAARVPKPINTAAPPEPESYNNGLNYRLRGAGVNLVAYAKNPIVGARHQIKIWEKEIKQLRRHENQLNTTSGRYVTFRNRYEQDIAVFQQKIGKVTEIIRGYV